MSKKHNNNILQQYDEIRIKSIMALAFTVAHKDAIAAINNLMIILDAYEEEIERLQSELEAERGKNIPF